MHKLPTLPYEYSALEPHVDARTMEIHHTKHHQGYVDKLNAALESYPELQAMTIEELLMNFEEKVPDEIKTAVRNNGGGHANHSLFWQIMTPDGKDEMPQELTKAFEVFESFENFKEIFTKEALSRFGSGWTWLVADKNGKLEVYSTPNQDSPLMQGKTPLLGLDVWEHAYYLNYQNRRADYAQVFWNIVDWSEITKRHQNMGL